MSYQEVIDRIANELEIESFDVVRGERPEVKGCLRAEFVVRVHPDTFDLFFNSPYGYRGQYLADPKIGLQGNSALLEAISDPLVEYAQHNRAKREMSQSEVRRSLQAHSAKVWIDESGTRKPRGDDVYEQKPDLLVPRWLKAADLYREKPTVDRHAELAIDGTKCPEGEKLGVKGAFFSGAGEECIPENKRDRDLHIHRYGFS